ncbi:hypothetical protein BDB01DRAFT_784322 [Pilobolus umbonatus]|nr:hypothetical protein BDB01DRAFT_784322 [Pilobolus umbonatus]
MLSFIEERRLPVIAYPLRGFAHLLHNPKRHTGPIFRSIVKVAVGSLITTIPIFKYGYGFQRGLLTHIYQSKGSPSLIIHLTTVFTATLLCLIESSAVTIVLSDYIVGSISNRLFDSVLKEKELLPPPTTPAFELVEISEKIGGLPIDITLKQHAYLSPCNLMIISSEPVEPLSLTLLKAGIFLLTLPLNIVPVVGPITFISIQGLFVGGAAHQRYYHHYKWSPAQRQRRIEKHFWQYHKYGIMASLMEMVPFAGYLFMYTNYLGAALWAVDMHNRRLIEYSKSN